MFFALFGLKNGPFLGGHFAVFLAHFAPSVRGIRPNQGFNLHRVFIPHFRGCLFGPKRALFGVILAILGPILPCFEGSFFVFLWLIALTIY